MYIYIYMCICICAPHFSAHLSCNDVSVDPQPVASQEMQGATFFVDPVAVMGASHLVIWVVVASPFKNGAEQNVHAYIPLYIYICIYIDIHVLRICIAYICVYKHSCIYLHMYIYIFIYIHTSQA